MNDRVQAFRLAILATLGRAEIGALAARPVRPHGVRHG